MKKEQALEEITRSIRENWIAKYNMEPSDSDTEKFTNWASTVLGEKKDFNIFNILEKDRGQI